MDGTPMTSPLSPEAVAQLVADREAGTPGPWRESQTWRPPIGNGPHSDMVNGNIFWGYSISGSNEGGGHIYPTLAAVHNFPDHIHANARRIARLPDLEAAYLTLAAENATLRQERDGTRETLRMIKAWDFPGDIQDLSVQIEALRASEAAALERIGAIHAIANELSWAAKTRSIADRLRAALTPTADKEPKI